MKHLQIHHKTILKILLSATLLLSVLGKLSDTQAASMSINELFNLRPTFAEFSVLLLVLIEASIALLIWWRVPKVLLLLPLAFLLATIYSKAKNLDCGCFGELLFLSNLSFEGHLILISGIFLGLYYLARSDTKYQNNIETKSTLQTISTKHKPSFIGFLSIVLILIAYGTLPLTVVANDLKKLPDSQYVDYQYVRSLLNDAETVIIDARAEWQFGFGHIEGALNIPYNSKQIDEAVKKYNFRARHLIIYCNGIHCDAAERLAKRLAENGCRNLKVYHGGWEDWQLHEQPPEN